MYIYLHWIVNFWSRVVLLVVDIDGVIEFYLVVNLDIFFIHFRNGFQPFDFWVRD